jgi:hypothetical protein
MHDFDTQRQADMRRVDQNFGQLEGQTGAELARSREMLNSLVKVSQEASGEGQSREPCRLRPQDGWCWGWRWWRSRARVQLPHK